MLGGVPLTQLFDDPDRFGAPRDLATPAYVYDLQGMVDEARSLGGLKSPYILQVLDACGGSQSEAAHVLGIARNTLW